MRLIARAFQSLHLGLGWVSVVLRVWIRISSPPIIGVRSDHSLGGRSRCRRFSLAARNTGLTVQGFFAGGSA